MRLEVSLSSEPNPDKIPFSETGSPNPIWRIILFIGTRLDHLRSETFKLEPTANMRMAVV